MSPQDVLPLAPVPALAWAAALLGGASATVAAVGAVRWRPRIVRAPEADVLVLAAHQDDCAISAGEVALEALRAGRRVDLCFLTCGAEAPDAPLARTRRAEALAVWERVGVPADRVAFLDRPESPVLGRWTATPEEEAALTTALEARLRDLAPGTAVFVPGEGESHPDHRALRRLALEAGRRLGRKDLRWLETVSYNRHFTLYRLPGRSLRTLLECVPFRRPGQAGRSGFFAGGPPCRLADDPARLARKRELLAGFASQNPARLLVLFGQRDVFRDVQALDPEPARAPGFLQLGKRLLGPSHLLLHAAFLCAIAAGAGRLARPASNAVGMLAAALVAALAFAPGQKSVHQRATLLGAAGGLLLGTLT